MVSKELGQSMTVTQKRVKIHTYLSSKSRLSWMTVMSFLHWMPIEHLLYVTICDRDQDVSKTGMNLGLRMKRLVEKRKKQYYTDRQDDALLRQWIAIKDRMKPPILFLTIKGLIIKGLPVLSLPEIRLSWLRVFGRMRENYTLRTERLKSLFLRLFPWFFLYLPKGILYYS